MFLARRPCCAAIERFLAASQSLPLSDDATGLTHEAETDEGRCSTPPSSFEWAESVAHLGRGAPDFERARAALLSWTPFALGWVELFPRDASIEPGSVVAVLIRHLGFWSLNGCRIVYTVGGRGDGTRFGFAYGTLTNQAESGEELFEVAVDPETGDVRYRIRAAARPRAALARLGHPVVRALQARFRRDSVKAMKAVMSGSRA